MSESSVTPIDLRQADHVNRHIVALVFKLARHLGTAMDRRVAPFNVTGQQAALLVRSCVVSDLTPSQLAPWLGTDNAGITRLVDRLEAKGLVARRTSAADRRAVVIEPTAAGRDLVPHLIAAFDETTTELLDGFTPAELSIAESSLRRLLGNVAMCGPESHAADHVPRPHVQAPVGDNAP